MAKASALQWDQKPDGPEFRLANVALEALGEDRTTDG